MLMSPLASPADWNVVAEARTLPAGTRYAGRRLHGVRCTTAANRGLRAPMAAVVRAHDGGQLLEVEPAAFLAYAALRACVLGLPEIYLWLNGQTFAPPAQVSAAGDTLLSTTDVWIAVTGQDGLLRDPLAWAAVLRQAWESGGEDTADWQAFEDELTAALPAGASAPVLVTDHTGAPLAERRVQITLPDGGDAGVWEVDLLTAHDGDLQAAVAAAGLAIDSVFSGGASQAELRILPAAGAAEAAEDQWATYTGVPGAATAAGVAQPAGRHFTYADLHQWFAPQSAAPAAGSPFGPALARLHRGNQVVPLLDGYEAFASLVEAFRAVQAAGGSVNMTGWDFHHLFELVPEHVRDRFGLAEDDDLTLLALTRTLSDAGRPARFLVNRFFQLEETPPIGAVAILVMLLVFVIALQLLRDSPVFEARLGRELGVLVGLIATLGLGVVLNLLIADDVELLEPSGGAREDLDDLAEATALWAPYPATKADNPLSGGLTGDLTDFAGVDHVGVYHQKMTVVEQGGQLVGFAGGIDVNPNRLDDPDHNVESPFHDTHARVEGPATLDLFRTFRARWRHQTGAADAMPDEPAAPAPAGDHVVQVARTYFRPAGAARALPFAPDGDFTVHDTLLRAIEQAREFIYIEDQYFTPPADYQAALLAALPRIQKLIAVVPRTTDQPFGALYRQTFFDQLVAAGGDKVILVSPVRRPHSALLPRIAAGGRFELVEALEAVPAINEEIVLGPSARVPRSAPFWLCVEGELMYVDANVSLPFGAPASSAAAQAPARFRVKRGGFLPSRLVTEPRRHEIHAAALVVEMAAVYVHSKLMIVDDVFLSVGSANLNRRGMRHDGELNLFTMSDHLRADPARNVARAFRMRLWADHLGLPPGVAAPLVADPIAGSRLFGRNFFAGNRSVHPDFFGLDSVLDLTPGASPIIAALQLVGVGIVSAEYDTFFDTIVDPTSAGP